MIAYAGCLMEDFYRPQIEVESEAARIAEQKLMEIWEGLDSVFLGWRITLKNDIHTLAAECSYEDWDGEGGFPITYSAVKAAERFIDLLPDSILLPYISPENTGEILFNWSLGKNITLNVIISMDFAIYAGIFGEERINGMTRVLDEMPSVIRTILLRYFRK